METCNRQKSFSHSAIALVFFLLVVTVEVAHSYDVSVFSDGCHKFPTNHSFYYQPPQKMSTVTVEQCRTDCNHQKYAALWLGSLCSCFEEIHTTAESDALCTNPCNGNGGQLCGSDAYMNVYKAEVSDERIPSQIAITDGLTNGNDPLEMNSWYTHTATAEGDFDTLETPSHLLEISDGSGRPVDQGIHYVSETGALSFTLFKSSHQYELWYTITDADSVSLHSTTLVQTKMKMRDVMVKCPQYAAATHEIECTASATGNKMTLRLDFGDGTQRTMSLGDAITETAGSVNDYGLPTATEIVAHDLYFLPNSVFKHRGKLLGFKFHAGDFHTAVAIQIFRPSCDMETTNTYCYHTDSCVNVNHTCDGNLGTRSTMCASTHVWSFSSRRCVDNGGVGQYNNRLWAEIGGDYFEMVHEFLPHIVQTGWQSHADYEWFEILPGDMIGVVQDSASGAISYINRQLGTRGYRGVPADPYKLAFASLTSEFTTDFLLEAYISRPVDVIVKKTFAYEIDEVNVTATLTSTEHVGIELFNYTHIDVQIGISGVYLISGYSDDTCYGSMMKGMTNLSHPFIIPPHEGELPRYTLKWDDGTYRLKTKSQDFSHTFSRAGVYNVTVYAMNEVSDQMNWTTISIQDKIQGLALDKDYFITALDNQSTLYISIDQGTNVTYTITIYDLTGTEYVLYHDSDNALVPGEHFGFNAYINYTFGMAGNWTMKVVAENCISRSEAILWFKVEVPIIGLDIIEVPPIAYGNSTLIYFSIVNGTDITFWSTFDGLPTREWVMHEAGIVGHQYNDVGVLKATLIYNLMHDWIMGGRIGPVPISVAEAEEFGLGEMVTKLASLGQSPLEMLAGPMDPVVLSDDNNFSLNDSSLLSSLEDMAAAQREKASIRCPRDLDGCSWHHGMAFIIPDDYNVTGPHLLELFAENIVEEGVVSANTTLWVEYIIEGLVMQANETFVKTNDMVLFNVTVWQLSRANTSIYYGDSHVDMEWRYEMLTNDTIEFYHAFNESGNYTVEVHSVNNISESKDYVNMTIQDPVTAVYLRTNSPVTRPWERGGVAQFMIYWDPDEALMPTDAFIWISYGVDNLYTDEFLGFDNVRHNLTVSSDESLQTEYDWLLELASDDPTDLGYLDESEETRWYQINAFQSLTEYTYWDYGDYNVSINVSNLVSHKKWDFVLVVDQDVLDLDIQSDVYNLTFGFHARFDVTRRWGSRINLTWDYRDSHPNDTAQYKPDEENFMIHTFDEIGVFWVKVIAENSVGISTATLQEPIIVQHPVIGFSLECSLEMVLLEHSNWATPVDTYLFLDKKYPLATNVTAVFHLDVKDKDLRPVVVDLNEAYAACDKSRENATHYHILTINHVYALGAKRYLGVQLFNLVSDEFYNDTLDVFDDIHNLTLGVFSVLPEHELQYEDEKIWQYGHTPLMNRFPLDELIVIYANMYRGSFIDYIWDFGDGTTKTNYETDIEGKYYYEVGWYTVKLNASNPLSKAYAEITFEILRGVGPVSIFTPTPLTRNTTIEMTVDPGWIGTDACYFLDFGAEIYYDDMHYYYFFGDESYCVDMYSNLYMADEPEYRHDYDFDQLEKRRLLDLTENANFTLEFNYEEIGVYKATIEAKNEVSHTKYTLFVGVTRGPCEWPLVDLRINSQCLLEALCGEFRGEPVKQHFRSEMLEVKAAITVNCSSTKIYHHTWWLDEVDPVTGDTIRSVKNTELANSRGEIPQFYKNSSIPSVVVPGNRLTYGLYRFSLNVSMDGEIGIETIDFVYIEIVKSDIKAAVVGGVSRRKGWGKNVTFDAISESSDPDYPSDKTGFTCIWLCKRENESWPVYNDDYSVELIPFQVLRPSYYYPDDSGGCFRDSVNSSGRFPIPPWGTQDEGGCRFTYDFFYAYENEKVEFKVIVKKDTRMKEVHTYVDITEGDPPEIDITSEAQCLSNCGDKLNYAAKYTVEARVTNGRVGTIYSYEWNLVQYDDVGEDVNPYFAYQFAHPEKTFDKEKWRNCADYSDLTLEEIESKRAEIGRFIDFCMAASTGLNRQAITIEKNLFTAADATSTFFLYVKVNRPRSTTFGETYRRFNVNTPPSAGECKPTPENGSAIVTKFNVHCDVPFEDEHMPLSYEVTYAASDCCLDDPSAEPLWKYFHRGDNPYSINGGVLSEGDANNDYIRLLRIRCFDSIGSWTDVYTSVYVTPASPEVIAEQAALMMSSAGSDLMSNPEIANNQIMAVCITMNKAKSNCTECDKNDYVGLIPEDGDETPEEYAERLYQHCKTAELDCWHEVLRNKMTVKEAMLGNLKIDEPKTVAGCELKMATLVEVTGNPEELSGDAQDEVASQSKYCVLLLVNTDQKLDITTTENTANSALSTAGSAMISAHQNQKDEQEEQLGIASQSEAHAEVRRRRKKRSSGLTAQETQMDLLKTVDSIGSIVGSSKAAGESPSKFSTPVMNLAVNKAWGDKASNVPADDGNGFNLPSSDSLFPDANDTSQLVMSSQVVSQPSNPFVGKNDSSNDTLSINSAVVMLSLTNSTGGNIDLGNLTKPTHVFIKRDRNDVSIERIVQKAGEYENDGDRTPFIIHKVKVPAASSLHIRVVQTWQFNTTNCSAINLTMADNETMEYCNWTSTLETAPQPTWLDVSTSKPTTVSTQFFTTTLADVLTTTNTRAIMTDNHTRSSTSFGSTNSGADRTSTSVPSTTTTASVPGSTSTQASQSTGAILGGETTILSFDVTPNWIQESTNKTGWILYIGQGSRPSLSRPESYITCELPFLNDQIKLLQRDIRMNQVDQNNASIVLNNTDIPDWLWNLPANLEKDLDTCFFSNSFFDSTVEMDVYIGIKYLPPANVSSTSNVSDWLESTTPAPMRKRREAAANETDLTSQMEELVQDVLYQLEFYTAQCKIWNHYIQDWETEGCEVGPYSSPTNTHCICTKLTRDPPDDWVPPLPRIDPISGEEIPPASAPPMSFGAALAVPTNEIDLSGAAFANLGENPLVFSFMVSLMCLYLCLCIWARAADIKDEIKSSTSPLLDNDPRDKYFYELIVYTGSTSGSGTTAKVSMIFSGDEDETPPRLIFDDKKKVLEKGGIDSFIMAVPQSLGSLNVCRVWHDNSGKNPSWNFSRVQVTDLQTNEKFFFVLDRWLAVDQDDGCIDRVIPVAGKEELTNFNLVFWNKARRDITDGHIWFSVFGRPHRSRFTRIQRLTCCLSLLFCTMFANILFYQGDEAQSSSSPPIKIGPISLTLQMLLTGIYASLIVFPINLIIVMVFRYSGDRPKRLPTAVREKKKNDEKMLSQSTLELRQQAEYLTSGDDNNRLLTNLNTTAVDDWGATNKKQKKKFMLPWWFIIVGYLMCLGSIIWCFISVVGVAFNFGPTKAAEWLTSFCLSFLESVLCTQPLKVLGLAAFYALVIKSPAVEDEDERDPELQKDEVYVHEHKRAKDIHNPRFRRRLKKFTKIPLPPSEEYLKAARLLRHKEVKMMDLLKEMALYLIFIYLLLMVGYGNRDPWAHHFYKNVKNLAAHGIWSPNNMGYDISNVKDPGTFYRWLEDTLVASYYSTEVYDGERHWWTTNFSADYNSVPAGKPRLRLLRTKDYECNMPVYLYEKRCSRPYSMSGEDKESYKAGWVPLNHTDTELMYPDEGFTYNTSLSLFGFPTSGDTATYGGGGYVFDLSHIQSKTYERIQYLKDIEWIDPQTRAVFVEFNLYNSAVNLFAVSYILFEFLPTGSIIPSFKVQIFRLDRYIGAQALTTMVAEILMTLYIIYYLVREIKSIRKLKREYFKSLWNVFEIAVLIASMFSFILYFIRLYICLTTMKRFRSDKTAFHNFQLAAGIDQLYGFFMAFILFASTIKFTKLLRFNKRIMTLAISMVAIFKPLAGFGVMFGISFFAFAQMAYMIFVNNLLAFSTFGASIGTLLSMMLNKFDYPVLERANPVFAPIIFLAFVGMMTMLMVNFLLTIIIDTYTEVKSELMQQENEYELIEFITGKIKGLVGRAPPPKLPKMRNEGDGFVDDKQVELSSRVEELMDKFMEIVTSDPQQRRLADEIEQKRKFLKNGVGVKRKIVTG